VLSAEDRFSLDEGLCSSDEDRVQEDEGRVVLARALVLSDKVIGV